MNERRFLSVTERFSRNVTHGMVERIWKEYLGEVLLYPENQE